jgi:hypothetical protein
MATQSRPGEDDAVFASAVKRGADQCRPELFEMRQDYGNALEASDAEEKGY